VISSIFFGIIRLNFENSLFLRILNIVLEISKNWILLFKNILTKLSFAVTIIVSKRESLFGSTFKIFTTGNLFKSIFSKFKLLIIENQVFLI